MTTVEIILFALISVGLAVTGVGGFCATEIYARNNAPGVRTNDQLGLVITVTACLTLGLTLVAAGIVLAVVFNS